MRIVNRLGVAVLAVVVIALAGVVVGRLGAGGPTLDVDQSPIELTPPGAASGEPPAPGPTSVPSTDDDDDDDDGYVRITPTPRSLDDEDDDD